MTPVIKTSRPVPPGTHPDFASGFRSKQPGIGLTTPPSRHRFGDGRDFIYSPEH